MTPTRTVHTDGWSVRLGLGCQVLRLEIPENVSDWDRGRRDGPPLLPVLPLAVDGPVSAATLLLKAKQFDDRLNASIDLAAQQGGGRFRGKALLLRSLATALVADSPGGGAAAALLHAACELGGLAVECPQHLREAVRALVQDFLRDENRSKPLGFYTWTPELSAIFRQDRFLQQPLDPGPADTLAQALVRIPGASDAHASCLRLHSRLTNPAKKLSPQDAGKCQPFFPPSRSYEVALLEGLYGDRPIPEGFDLMGELIRRVRSGEIDLTPTETSGWYDRQAWSLEPLVVPDRMPEKARLELGKRYHKHLEDLFRGALALARETHVRQIGGGAAGCGGFRQQPIWINPGLTVEPLPSLYARRAGCYRFVRSVLEEEFGADALREMPRITPERTSAGGLAEELAWMESLFAGAAATASRELGMQTPEGDETARCFSAWRAALKADRDVSSDARMMVPVFYDVQRKKTKVWAFLGWRRTDVDVSYRVPPTVLAVEPSAAGVPPPVLFTGASYELATPVTAEVYVERLLDRDEFRSHCNRFQTGNAILANLH